MSGFLRQRPEVGQSLCLIHLTGVFPEDDRFANELNTIDRARQIMLERAAIRIEMIGRKSAGDPGEIFHRRYPSGAMPMRGIFAIVQVNIFDDVIPSGLQKAEQSLKGEYYMRRLVGSIIDDNVWLISPGEVDQEFRIGLRADFHLDPVIRECAAAFIDIDTDNKRPRKELRPHPQRRAAADTDFQKLQRLVSQAAENPLVMPQVILPQRRLIGTLENADRIERLGIHS